MNIIGKAKEQIYRLTKNLKMYVTGQIYILKTAFKAEKSLNIEVIKQILKMIYIYIYLKIKHKK